MTFPIIGLHAWLGEFGALMFIWAFIELLTGADDNIRRARMAVNLGLVLLFGAWLVGGHYYIDIYGAQVKPAIKEGPMPWAHGVAMETKEHIFLFLPFLGLLAQGLLRRMGNAMAPDPQIRLAAQYAVGAVAVMAGLIALLGFLVSSGFRAALERLVL